MTTRVLCPVGESEGAQVESDERDEEEPVGRKPAGKPTEEELRVHRVSHILFRDWCPECVAGRAKDWPRRPRNRQEILTALEVHFGLLLHPRVRWGGLQCGAGGEGQGNDVDLGTCCAFQGWRHRVSNPVCRDLRKFGTSGDVVFKTDQEPA